MFSAIDKYGKAVWITPGNTDYLRKSSSAFYCPCCQSKLRIKSGNKNTPHFYHPMNAHCEASGETMFHLMGKQLLAQFFTLQGIQADVEVFFAAIKRQADVLLQRKIVIEFQCSPITSDEILQRTVDYQSLNLRVFWVLGYSIRRNKDQMQLTRFLKNFLSYSADLGYCILYFDSYAKQASLFYDLTSTMKAKKYVYREITFSTQTSIKTMLEKMNTIQPRVKHFYSYELTCSEKEERIHHYTRFRQHRPFVNFLYKNGYKLHLLPSFLGVILKTQILVATPALEWQVLVWHYFLKRLKQGEIFAYADYVAVFRANVRPNVYPMIDKQAYLRLAQDYLVYLKLKNYLCQKGTNLYIIQQALAKGM